jgi:acyl carrier protein
VEQDLIALIVARLALPPDVVLDATTRFTAGGLSLDSIRMLELTDAVEKHFGVELDAGDLAAMTTIGAFAARLREKLGR